MCVYMLSCVRKKMSFFAQILHQNFHVVFVCIVCEMVDFLCVWFFT